MRLLFIVADCFRASSWLLFSVLIFILKRTKHSDIPKAAAEAG
jgi:hypothetical protein